MALPCRFSAIRSSLEASSSSLRAFSSRSKAARVALLAARARNPRDGSSSLQPGERLFLRDLNSQEMERSVSDLWNSSLLRRGAHRAGGWKIRLGDFLLPGDGKIRLGPLELKSLKERRSPGWRLEDPSRGFLAPRRWKDPSRTFGARNPRDGSSSLQPGERLSLRDFNSKGPGQLPCCDVRAVSHLSVVQDLRDIAGDRSFKHVYLCSRRRLSPVAKASAKELSASYSARGSIPAVSAVEYHSVRTPAIRRFCRARPAGLGTRTRPAPGQARTRPAPGPHQAQGPNQARTRPAPGPRQARTRPTPGSVSQTVRICKFSGERQRNTPVADLRI